MKYFSTVLFAILMTLATPTVATAHSTSRRECAQSAHKEMVQTPPHTTQQRREAFLQCLTQAQPHELMHEIQRCANLRIGDSHTRWTVRSACKIMAVWPYDRADKEAVTVAWCEGGFNPDASNGQYRGTFQMGSGERSRFGHGSTIESQTVAASRYYDYARKIGWGRGWGPWSCKPGSYVNAKAWVDAPPVLRAYVARA